MGGTARSRRRETECTWLALGQGNQLGHGLHGKARRHHENVGDQRRVADRREVPDRVVAHAFVEVPVDGKDASGAHQQGVAVSCRLGNGVGADIASRASAIFDHKGLLELRTELVRKDARDHVCRSASCKRHDDAHRLVWVAVVLGMAGGGENRHVGKKYCAYARPDVHENSLKRECCRQAHVSASPQAD